MLDIENLSFTYPGSEEGQLSKVSLHIEKGTFVALIGSNGCGKSTLCKTMNGLIPHYFNGDFKGKVLVDGIDTKDASIGQLARKVGYVYQDFENQIICPTLLDDASFACMNYGFTDYRERGLMALEKVGLLHKAKEFIWELSGGQKHLLALASMLALDPKLLILDEPIAQLDPGHAKVIYECLHRLNEDEGMTIIVIEHHMRWIAEYCKEIILMEKGSVCWHLPVKEAFSRIEELKAQDIYPPAITKLAYDLCKGKKEAIRPRDILPIRLQDTEFFQNNGIYLRYRPEKKSDIIQITKEGEKSLTLVSMNDVNVEYSTISHQKKVCFSKLTCQLRAGERIAIIGNNGAGKTTFLKLLSGLIRPNHGHVVIDGQDIRHKKPEWIAKDVAFVYQNPEEMFICDSIKADIEYAMKNKKIKHYESRTEDLIKNFNLEEVAHKDGRLLSGGQMRRASMAIGVATKPKVLLLDEPTANLDMSTRQHILETLTTMETSMELTIMASHDMELVAKWANRILVIYDGEIVADGDRKMIFTDRELLEKVGIEAPEIYQLGRRLDIDSVYFDEQKLLEDMEVMIER